MIEHTLEKMLYETRRKFTSEERILIVLEGLQGEFSIADLCHRFSMV